MVKYILDIDGTLMDSSEFFSNTTASKEEIIAKQETPEFQKSLLDLAPFDWVLRWKHSIQEASEVVVITGRGAHLMDVSKKWIEYNLGLTGFDIIPVPFKDYQQYIRDKILAMNRELDRMCNNKEHLEVIHVIEDDTKIVRAALNFRTDPPKDNNIFVHQVLKGILVQMVLKPITSQGQHGELTWGYYLQARME